MCGWGVSGIGADLERVHEGPRYEGIHNTMVGNSYSLVDSRHRCPADEA